MLDSWIIAIVFVTSFTYAVWYVSDRIEHPRMSRRDVERRTRP